MYVPILCTCETLFTAVPVTGIRLLPCVNAFVYVPVLCTCETLFTAVPVTGIRLLLGVDAFVEFLEQALVYSRPITGGFLWIVCGEKRCFKMTFFTAVPVTGIRLLPGVDTFVFF